jgi:transcriptional regulator with GAF, ATPase, and Fis domain
MANALSTEEEFIGVSSVLRQIQAQLREVAQSKMTVLILGETGTGKSIAARYVHEGMTYQAWVGISSFGSNQ